MMNTNHLPGMRKAIDEELAKSEAEKNKFVLPLPYTVEVTRIVKGKYARTGFIFIQIRHKNGNGKKYTAWAEARSKDLNEELKAAISDMLWQEIVKKHGK